VSMARLIFAGTLLCLSGAVFAQSSPATQWTGGGTFQNPPAATAGDAKAGAPASTPGTDPSAKKTFNESRSNNTRTPGDAKGVAPGAEPSGNKSFFESRSNTARTPGDAKAATPDAAPSGNKSFFESRSNTVRRAEDKAKPAVGQAAAGASGNPMVTNTAPAQPAPK
jgi:hypothetical protein